MRVRHRGLNLLDPQVLFLLPNVVHDVDNEPNGGAADHRGCRGARRPARGRKGPARIERTYLGEPRPSSLQVTTLSSNAWPGRSRQRYALTFASPTHESDRAQSRALSARRRCGVSIFPSQFRRRGLNRQAADTVSCGARIAKPLATGSPGRLCASTECVTGSKQKKSALAEGE